MSSAIHLTVFFVDPVNIDLICGCDFYIIHAANEGDGESLPLDLLSYWALCPGP